MRYIDMGFCCFIFGKVKWYIFVYIRIEILVGKKFVIFFENMFEYKFFREGFEEEKIY